jgi:hypothetical protein
MCHKPPVVERVFLCWPLLIRFELPHRTRSPGHRSPPAGPPLLDLAVMVSSAVSSKSQGTPWRVTQPRLRPEVHRGRRRCRPGSRPRLRGSRGGLVAPSRVRAEVGTGLGGVTGWHICEGSRQLADRLLIRSTRWARPEPATPGTGQMKGRPRGGQIRSESPGITGTDPSGSPPRTARNNTHRSVDQCRMSGECAEIRISTSETIVGPVSTCRSRA